MLISELIAKLETIKSREGDITVEAGCQSEGIAGEPEVFIWRDGDKVEAYIDFYGACGDRLERV